MVKRDNGQTVDHVLALHSNIWSHFHSDTALKGNFRILVFGPHFLITQSILDFWSHFLMIISPCIVPKKWSLLLHSSPKTKHLHYRSECKLVATQQFRMEKSHYFKGLSGLS